MPPGSDFWQNPQNDDERRFVACGGVPPEVAEWMDQMSALPADINKSLETMERLAVQRLCNVWTAAARARGYGADLTPAERASRRRTQQLLPTPARATTRPRTDSVATRREKYAQWLCPAPVGGRQHRTGVQVEQRPAAGTTKSQKMFVEAWDRYLFAVSDNK